MKDIFEVFILIEDSTIIIVFFADGENKGFYPDFVGIIEEFLDKEPACKTSLITCIIAVRFAVKPFMNTENATDAVAEKESLGTGIIWHVDKELIFDNIQNMGVAEPFGKGFDILDGGIGVEKGKGFDNGGL